MLTHTRAKKFHPEKEVQKTSFFGVKEREEQEQK